MEKLKNLKNLQWKCFHYYLKNVRVIFTVVEQIKILPVEPIDPLLPVTDNMLDVFTPIGSSKGGRFPFHIKLANQEQ